MINFICKYYNLQCFFFNLFFYENHDHTSILSPTNSYKVCYYWPTNFFDCVNFPVFVFHTITDPKKTPDNDCDPAVPHSKPPKRRKLRRPATDLTPCDTSSAQIKQKLLQQPLSDFRFQAYALLAAEAISLSMRVILIRPMS